MGLFNLKGDQPKHIGSSSAQYSSSPKTAQSFVSSSGGEMSASKPEDQNAEPPPYHDWTIIPDTALLPPPPTVFNERSTTSNAELDEADRAHEWCKAYPLLSPHQPDAYHIKAVENGDINLIRPSEFVGQLNQIRSGSWAGQSKAKMKDSLLLTSLPLYFAYSDSPNHTSKRKTIYFEVEIRGMHTSQQIEESSVAIGFCALPQPTWRLPGWERATLGVHSDDGRRYVNNTWGGKDFTTPFKAGDTVGIGMSFNIPQKPPEYDSNSLSTRANTEAEVFFTRNGNKDGSWDLHEEQDIENERPIDGLDGLFDLYGAVGIFGGVDFLVKFRRDEWLWRPH